MTSLNLFITLRIWLLHHLNFDLLSTEVLDVLSALEKTENVNRQMNR